MQLITILLATVSVLTVLSGTVVFFGASRGDKARSAWFFAAAIFATIWMVSMSAFVSADPSWADPIDWQVRWIFVSAILIDIAFLGYISWREKYGKLMTLFFLLFGAIVSSLIMFNPGLLYKEIVLSYNTNSIIMNIGPLYFSYIAFFATVVPAVLITLLKQYVKTTSDRRRGGDLIIMAAFGISSTLTLAFNLILPLFGNWSLVWIGPLALATTIIAFYYTILRYRAVNLVSVWLKLFSYIVVFASLAIVYMVIFSLIFAALFRGSAPSIEVIALNFIMIFIFLILMPAISGLMSSIHDTIDGKQMVKKQKR